MSESYWLFCIDGPDGEQICTELYVPARDLGDDLQQQLKSLGELQEFAVQVPNSTLQVRLLEVVDDTALQISNLLPEGMRLRLQRGDGEVALDDEPVPFVGVPDVVGLSHVDAFNTLRGLGYGAKTVWEWTSDVEENFVSAQDPIGGSGNLPPTVVRLFVRTLPPDEPVPFDPPVIISE